MDPQELVRSFDRLDSLNRDGADIYFGVNPRAGREGTKQAVVQCRTLWADLDDIHEDQLNRRLIGFPKPSVVVSSGHGYHLYWLLEQPQDVSGNHSRACFEHMLRSFCSGIEGDATHDVTRILRLPGFTNLKREPVPCEIAAFDLGLKYPTSRFDQWLRPIVESTNEKVSEKSGAKSRNKSLACDVRDVGRIRGLIRYLDRDVEDRSRRDFGVICQLLRLGLTAESIRQLVEGHSKFTSEDYITLTLKNALRALGR
jgi:hypothetical protein